jgi:hypothetical protein
MIKLKKNYFYFEITNFHSILFLAIIFLLVIIIKLLLCLIYKLNFIIGVYK